MQPAVTTARDNKSAPTRNDRIAQDAVPLPQPAPQSRTAALRDGAHRVVADAVADTRSIWEKLFGKPASALTLAYAGSETGSLGSGHDPALGLYDRSTAVYDITAHKVYMPDGTALEAHSGLGAMLDDPRHADVKMRGVTPPAVYDLQPREALFHGVEALRLIPEDDYQALGRDGLLAHSYMLGPNGDSNGCVSFRDYERVPAGLQEPRDHAACRGDAPGLICFSPPAIPLPRLRGRGERSDAGGGKFFITWASFDAAGPLPTLPRKRGSKKKYHFAGAASAVLE